MITAHGHALLITPAFFGYEKDIAAELERQGFRTTLLDERPYNSALGRAIMRARKSLIRSKVDAYFRDWSTQLRALKLDLVLVVKAEVVPRWFLEELRTANPAAKFVFYTFDAIANSNNCVHVLDLFDRRMTFDRSDVERYPGFEYLPLFYTSDFWPLESDRTAHPRRYELAFVGTLHSERHHFATTLSTGLSRVLGFFYVQARWYFFILKYVTRQQATVKWSDVAFTPMTRAETADAFRNSHAVLDMQRNGQAGLTMRTFEVLASGAILVTTNSAITREPFYDSSRIIVVPPEPSDADREDLHARLRQTPQPGTPPGFETYALEAWVTELRKGVEGNHT